MKIKKLYQEPTRNVKYLGQCVTIPQHVNFLAISPNGFLFGYLTKPLAGEKYWHHSKAFKVIGECDLEGLDWRETLREV